MALFARSLELCGITHSGFAVETTGGNGKDTTYGIRTATYVNSAVATDWLGVVGIDGGPFAGTFYHRGFFSNLNGTAISAGRTLLEYSDNGGTPVFRLQATASDVIQPQYWNAGTAAWVNTGVTFNVPNAGTPVWKYDLKIICGTSFEFAITNNPAIEPDVVSSGAVGAAVTNINTIKTYSSMNAATVVQAHHSEWIWGDEPTIGHRYAWKPPSGNGTYTAGSGAFGDVDESPTTDADVSTLAANGDAETYIHAAMGLPAVGTVKAVQIEARVRNTAGGAQNVKARIRVGGVDYDAGVNFASISASFLPYVYRWANNPAGGAWTMTTAGQVSNEFGMLGQT